MPEHVHVEDVGSGPALFCLHGIGSSSASFREQLRHFAPARRVLAWDAPGYARSADTISPPGMSGYADTAANVLVEHETGRADVLGVSFGGVIAIRLALRHPDLVRSLILVDTSFGSGASTTSAQAMSRRGEDLARMGAAGLAAQRASRLLSPDAPPELVAEVEQNMAASIRLPGYAHAAQAMVETDLREEVPRLSVPALVICGTADTVTGPELSRAISEGIAGARLAMIEGVGHLSNQEDPEHFNAIVEDFLDDLDKQSSSTPSASTTYERRTT